MLNEKYEDNCNILASVELLMEYLYCKFLKDNDRNYDVIPLADVTEIVTGGTSSYENLVRENVIH